MLSVSVASVALKSMRTVYEFDDGDSVCIWMNIFCISLWFLYPISIFRHIMFFLVSSRHHIHPPTRTVCPVPIFFYYYFNIASRIRNTDNH